MKYLKRFKTHSNYEEYINGGEAVLPNVSYTEDALKVYYNPIPHDYSQDYFTMVVTVGGDVTWTGTENNTLYYSKDNGTTWSEPSVSITLSVNEGDKVLWKGEASPTNEGIGTFNDSTDVRYTVEGNVMSLLFGDDFKGQTSLEDKSYAFKKLFYNNKNITSVEKLSLPATTLAKQCYSSMFMGCSSLTTAPELPATTLTDFCYYYMFSGCSSLVTAPELPATTLAEDCYYSMLRECSSLVTAPELPATTLASTCYSYMFSGCTSLVTAPELPATTLPVVCYSNMFSGCTNLNYIKCLATDISARYCVDDWVKNVASSGTFVKAASMTSWNIGHASGIPDGWTVVDA